MSEATEQGAGQPGTGMRVDVGAAAGLGLLLAIAYVGFVSLGLPDPVAGVAWPFVRQEFALPQRGFGLTFIALGAGYCLSSFLGGKLTPALGLGNLLWISSGLVSLAMFGNALAPVWGVMIACSVVWGLGSGGIDAGLNAYVSRHFSARHVNWLHACYSLGATLGPLLMTLMISTLSSWRLGYALVGGILLAMTVMFLATRDRWTDPVPASADATAAATSPVGLWAALGHLLVWLQICLFFLYTGLEFTVGQWCFSVLTGSRGVSPEVAGAMTSGYYAAIGVGRVLTGAISHRIGLDTLVRIAMATAVAGVGLFAFGGSPASLPGLLLVGLGLAPVFPCLMSRTPQRLGHDVAVHAVGFQVSAAMLGAATPGLVGLFVDRMGLELIPRFALVLAGLLFVTHEVLLRRQPQQAVDTDGAENAGAVESVL